MDKPEGKSNQNLPQNNSLPEVSRNSTKRPKDNTDLSSSHKRHANAKNEPTLNCGIWDKIKKTTVTDQITAFSTFIIMIATTAYAFIALSQWCTMKEQLSLEQRAWVGPILVKPAEYTVGDKKVYVKAGQSIRCGIIISNSGKTPARKVHYSIVVQALKAGETPTVKESMGKQDITVLQPGMALTINYPPITGVSNTNVDALTAGKDILFMYGIIRYEDIFNKAHWTRFCMYLASDLSTFSSCQYLNDTDG